MTVDLIVVGAGTAGLPLAIAAAEQGGRVLLFEKTDRIGGTLYRTGGNISAGGTRRQRERGIEDSPDAHYDELMRISHGGANAELSRLACDLAPGMIDWLDDNGFAFDPDTPAITFSHEPYTTPRTYWGIEPGLSVLAVFEKLIAPYLANGKIDVRFNTPVDRLIVENGRVVGVTAGGVEHRAPAVVLTSGGFTGNPDLFARLGGGLRPVSSGMKASTGDGILLAESVGAAIVNEGVFLPTVGGFVDPSDPAFVYTEGAERLSVLPRLIPQLRPPWEIWVDSNGDRFLREDEPDIEIREEAVKEHDLRFWIVWDEAILRAAPDLVPAWPAEAIRREAATGRRLHAASTLDDLAATMGVPAANLRRSIDTYNEAIASGTPDPLGRDHRPLPVTEPPFYAGQVHAYANLSWAGLSANTDLAVLRADGSPIDGLYAVGEILGFSTFSGRAHVGGMSVGPAIALGRYLGTRLGITDAAVARRVY